MRDPRLEHPRSGDRRSAGLTTNGEYEAFPDIAQRNFVQEFLEIPLLDLALRLPRGASILEIGCGRGVGLATVAKRLRPHRVVGVDVDPGLLRLARRDLNGAGLDVAVFQADARSLPLSTDSFDLVMSFGTLFHIADPEVAISEIKRVLRPGGRFVNETRVAQMLAHPVRSRHSGLSPATVDALGPVQSRILWSSHVVTDS